MGNPFLIGRRVQLRPIEESDAEACAAWLNHPELRDWIAGRFPMSVKDEKEWIADLSEKGPRRTIGLAIERRSDKKLLGTTGLDQIDWIHRRAMTGTFIGPVAMRGKGYGTEAKGLMLDYAFGELGLNSLWAMTIESNAASRRALEKQGYVQGGLMRRAFLVKGRWEDSLYYDILREDWEALRSRKKPARARRKRE